MIIHSFRLRITLLSLFTTAVLLGVFGVISWSLIRKSNLSQFDNTLKLEAMRQVTIFRRPYQWRERQKSGVLEQYPILAKDLWGEVLFRTDNWPAEITEDKIPVLAEKRGDRKEHDRFMKNEGRPPMPGSEADERHPPLRRAEGENRHPPMWGAEGDNRHPPLPGPLGDSRRPETSNLSQQELLAGLKNLPAPRFFTQGKLRVCVAANREMTVAITGDLSTVDAQMNEVGRAFAVAFPIVLVLTALGGWLVATRALKPVKALTRTAEKVTAKGLDQRIASESNDHEFNYLISVFNQMLDRLERSFNQATRFSANAAHELKTPLTILQGQLEQAICVQEDDPEEQQKFNSLLEEVQRLKLIIRKLLLFSQADSGKLVLTLKEMDLSETIEMMVEDAEILGPNLTINSNIAKGIMVEADPVLIRQVIQNLITNAIKYNRPEGFISFSFEATGKEAVFKVVNSGEGIAEADQPKLFEPFFRGSKSRNREVEGLGLGLSLAREIARTHQGELEIVDGSSEQTTFRLTLPRLS